MNRKALIAILLIVALAGTMAVAYAAGGRQGGGGKGCPGQCPNGTRLMGTITAIDSAAKSFDLSTPDPYVVKVTADTVIKSGPTAKTFTDLQIGQSVCAAGALNGNVLTAWMVNIRPCQK